MSSTAVGLGVAALLLAVPAVAQEVTIPTRSPRTGAVIFRGGGYKPRIDTEKALNGATPYKDTFGDASLLLIEGELQRFFYQGIGTAGLGLGLGYAEKYADAKLDNGSAAADKAALKVLPIQLNAFYKFDYAAFRWGIPLVPYAKLGLIYSPWWMTKGSTTEVVEGSKASGGKWGWGGTAGVSFLLDVLEPRFARDFDSDLGVNHSYLFAEYTHADVNNFGGKGLNLGSRRWMFGLALDY
ncbi:MXAN_2562 family outer membrane beta-barrel protein [Corallococcus sp. AS-1-12]|uniref:MXAN_2562 family outer membrane beta-barrel protein n=1 Tax=Corallococcus sp. AS-1-12 TaxID=2874598 RepID=UPI001CBC68E2|nr:MXAN_2562 family outer membrane beta-barrel protein [Corallococcus sp. AS-1-12]MBZ4334128.1 hypothetical protein [Corallococcus sp. AS-1-12]